MKTTPFLAASYAAIGVTGVDVIWMLGELFNHFEYLSDAAYLNIRFGILVVLLLGLIFTVTSTADYIKDGYMRADKKINKGHIRVTNEYHKRKRKNNR